MKLRLHFKVTQLHQLEVDTERYADYGAPQDDADEFAEWFEHAHAEHGVHEDLLERIDDRLSWVDTEDEVEITEAEPVTTEAAA